MNFFFFLSETVFFHVVIRGLLLFLEVKGCGRWLPLAVKGCRSWLGLLWGGRGEDPALGLAVVPGSSLVRRETMVGGPALLLVPVVA